MKSTQLIAFFGIMCSSYSLSAQSGLLQTITADAKNSATRKVVETAGQTVNKTVDKLLDGSLFKRKAAKPATPAATTTTTPAPAVAATEPIITNTGNSTELSIANTDYNSVLALAGTIKANKTVTDVQRAFNNGQGTINVSHGCKTDELLDEILKSNGDKYEVAQVDKGKITLKVKK